MKTIGIIGAMEEEVILLKDKLEIITVKEMLGLNFFMGMLYGNSVVIVRCGIGKVNAAICTQVLIDHFAVDYVINLGVAGAIHKDLNIGDIVISEDAMHHDFDTSVFGDPIGVISRMDESCFKADKKLIELVKECGKEIIGEHKMYVGRIASGDQFIGSVEAKNKIWKDVKAYCAEMEGAAVAHTCYLNKIPFVIIRAISDNADMKAEISFDKFVDIAAKNAAELVDKIIKSI